jgi:tetratricopeptide (TPR) repeat protein
MARRSKDVLSLVVRSVAHARLNDGDRAGADFGSAVKIDAYEAHASRAELRILLGDNGSQVLPDLDEMVRLKPDSGGAYLMRAAVCLGKDAHDPPKADLARARADCDQAVTLLPKSPGALALRGAIHSLEHDDRAAQADSNRATELDGEEVAAHLLRAEANLNLKEWARAIAAATRAIELEPAEAYAYALRGAAYAEQNQDDKATADLEQAAKLDDRFAKLKEDHKRNVEIKKSQQRFFSPSFPSVSFPSSALKSNPDRPPAETGSGNSWPWLLGVGAVAFVLAVLSGLRSGRRSP